MPCAASPQAIWLEPRALSHPSRPSESSCRPVLLASFLLQIALWAWVFVLCGEFADFGPAFYHSAVNYTTLGYGDVVMSPRWRLLGPLEAVNGVLMGGLAAAGLFAVLTRLGEELRSRSRENSDESE
jgi:hypothetical protein